MLSQGLFGLDRQSLDLILGVFDKNPKVEKVLIYGSRAKGTHKHNSDIDLSLVGSRLGISDLLRIDNDLDDLMLPYKIDLSLFSMIEDADMLQHIDEHGKVLFPLNP